MPKRVAVGVVTSDKAGKTRRVEIPRLVKVPKYGKYVRQRTICYVHDEGNESHVGDTVEIVESRQLSRTKRWSLVRIVARSRLGGYATEIAEREEAIEAAVEGAVEGAVETGGAPVAGELKDEG